ncbi:glycosyltransferase [Anaerolineales bacterium HSG24]|nr:glycosyltransferase [Anaerolineales bacterium HSG24]
MTRQDTILRHVNKAGWGIEIGPCYSPSAPKRDGYNVHIIDHLNREQLIKKYEAHRANLGELDLETIEEVDFVWQGQSYAELTGKTGFYDWIIASHMIEHTPDLIGFLKNCDEILNEDGIISLVIPDKRYCFDHFRSVTSLGKIIDSHIQPSPIHTPGTIAEFYLDVVSKAGVISWNETRHGDYQFRYSLADVREQLDYVINEKKYIDVHSWCFTPHSFRLLIHDLYTLGYISFKELSFSPTVNYEFFVTLGRNGDGLSLNRLEMLQMIEQELVAVATSKPIDLSIEGHKSISKEYLFMEPQKIADLYDAHYFATGCGLPYQRDEHWLNFFDGIAKSIIKEIEPQTVLDAGCAMGFLVENLRKQNVEAYGVDISEYAIENVHPDIAPYCRVGSVADPLPQRYDLIVSIEVLEHMPKAEAEQAVANFCQHADDILFSSTPFDYKEETHFNVQPLEYWAEQFARHGFFRDVDFDASFITNWAVRFRSQQEPPHRIVRDYERRFWLLWKENTDLRDLAQETSTEIRQHLAEKDALVAHFETEVARFEDVHATQLADLRKQHQLQYSDMKRSLSSHIQTLTTHRDALEEYRTNLENSIGWTLLQKLQNLRATLSPPGSSRDKFLEEVFQTVQQTGLVDGAKLLSENIAKIRSNQPTIDTPIDLPPEITAYHAWIADNEPTDEQLAQQRVESQQFVYRPLISFITPVYNPPRHILRSMIESILAQTYDHWQLCIVNRGSTVSGINELLDQFASDDQRIVVKHLSENLGISSSSNQALETATGEFVVIVDSNDVLAPNMLYELVSQLDQDSKADIIYFDEDRVSEDGTLRLEPLFKPRHSPHVLLSTNYLTHAVFRRQLLLDIGGFDSERDGAQDWDLAFRCIEKTDNVVHIPKVLYHWRKMPSSAEVTDVVSAQLQTIKAHITRMGLEDVQVSRPNLDMTRVIWPNSGAKVSIIIPTKNRIDLLIDCLSSIFETTTYQNYEIILVDNGSTDSATRYYYKILANDERVKIINYPGQFNYSVANNLGVKHAEGELLLFLNNDTQVLDAAWLQDLVGWVERPGVGIVGTKLIRPDGTIQHAGIIMGLTGHGSHIFDGSFNMKNQSTLFGTPEWYREYMAVTGACMMMRREVFEQVGGFDETYQIGYSDIEICLSATKAGYKVIYTPFAQLLHHEGASRGLDVPPSDVLRASIRLLPYVQQGDIYFHPNLSYTHHQPTLATKGEMNRAERIIKILQSFKLLNNIDDNSLKNLQDIEANMSNIPPSDDQTEKPRLMVVSHDLSASGAPVILYTLMNYMVKIGYDIDVYTPTDGILRQQYEQAGMKVYVIPEILGDSLAITKLVLDYDIIFINTILMWQFISVAKAMQKPSLWWIHESNHGLDLINKVPVIAEAFSIADAVVFPSQNVADLYAFLSQGDNYRVIPHGLNLGIEPVEETKQSPTSDKFRIVHVGSVEHRKGQDVLLKALNLLPEPIKQKVSCYFVGRILTQSFYQELSKLIPIGEDIRFLGEMSREQALDHIRSADLFVLSSRDEVLPVTILEAMALGKAIVATDVGGVAEIIEHRTNGLLVPSEDERALVICLMRLFYDRDYGQQLGEQARQTFQKNLTLDRFGEEMVQLIQEMAKS